MFRKTIALISPIRFKGEMLEKYTELSCKGYIVLLPVWGDTTKYGGNEESLMKLHKAKLMLCDSAYVMNVGGYMGRGTYEEIGYCVANNIPIEYLVPLKEKE